MAVLSPANYIVGGVGRIFKVRDIWGIQNGVAVMLYSIFLVCVVGTKDCDKFYQEIPRPLGVTASQLSDAEMQKICFENNKMDHSFDNPVVNPGGKKVKITPVDCVLSETPPKNMAPANGFIGYRD